MKRVEALKRQPLSADAFWEALRPILQEDEVTMRKLVEIDAQLRKDGPKPGSLPGEAYGFEARGYLGQYLVILPKPRLIAVRQRRRPPDYRDDNSLDSFVDFSELVRALVP
jgi:hypothetical protein